MPPKRSRPAKEANDNHNDNDDHKDDNKEEVPLKKRLRSATTKNKTTGSASIDDADEGNSSDGSGLTEFSKSPPQSPPQPSGSTAGQKSTKKANATPLPSAPANRKPPAQRAPPNPPSRPIPSKRGGRRAPTAPRAKPGPFSLPTPPQNDPSAKKGREPSPIFDIIVSKPSNILRSGFDPPLRAPSGLLTNEVRSFGNDHQLDPALRPEDQRQQMLSFGLRGWHDETVSRRDCQSRGLDGNGTNDDRWLRLITYELFGANINRPDLVRAILIWLQSHEGEISDGATNNGRDGPSGASPGAGPSGAPGGPGGGDNNDDDEDGDDNDGHDGGGPSSSGAGGHRSGQGSAKGPKNSNEGNTKDRKGKGRAKTPEDAEAPPDGLDGTASDPEADQSSEASLRDDYFDPINPNPPMQSSSSPAPSDRSTSSTQSIKASVRYSEILVRNPSSLPVTSLADVPREAGRFEWLTPESASLASEILGRQVTDQSDWLSTEAAFNDRQRREAQEKGIVYIVFIPTRRI